MRTEIEKHLKSTSDGTDAIEAAKDEGISENTDALLNSPKKTDILIDVNNGTGDKDLKS